MIVLAMDAIKAQRTGAEVAIGSGIGVVAQGTVLQGCRMSHLEAGVLQLRPMVVETRHVGGRNGEGRRNRND